jgi:hypothetical protein
MGIQLLKPLTARGNVWWARWADLISFRPPTDIQTYVKQRDEVHPWYFHKLEDGYGDINLDEYPIFVQRLPNGMSTPEQLLEYFRLNINDFVDNDYAYFQPYDQRYASQIGGPKVDAARWASANPERAVISINMNMPLTPWGGALNPDDGSVVCSEHAGDYWIFSTAWTFADQGHPVSGNREFGFHHVRYSKMDGYAFYTRGADRCTSLVDYSPLAPVFIMANRLWISLQNKFATFVNTGWNSAGGGGYAMTMDKTSERVDWDTVKSVAWKPDTQWV